MTTIERDKVWAVVPAYNEGSVIRNVISDVRHERYRIVVIDDGSADDTGKHAFAAGAVVVRHPINLGQGAGLQTGIEYALSRGADYVVTFDADGQHRAREIERILSIMVAAKADFVLGSRFLGATTNMPARRRLLLRAATMFTRFTTGLKITDAHNGLRAMTRRGAEVIHLRQNRMAHASEILHQIADSKLPYVEAPVTIDYTDYSMAKGQKISNSVGILIDLFARRLHR